MIHNSFAFLRLYQQRLLANKHLPHPPRLAVAVSGFKPQHISSDRCAAEAGADLKARDEDGLTSLMLAARSNENPEVISVLLKAGADLKARDEDGLTSLTVGSEV